ncbi:unnamed protein product [Oikopleura dioica]|uniref:FAD-binding domain-containing protein n=1 Tax=Oikopleura dioica TaxID=34765 RepID=E4YUZ7_OIKDI|nr:unnamed protein product [Oikopleura dioica]
MKETAIVVGAGLGGMTAALSLAFHGFKEIRIYEKSTKILNPIGAGIGINGSTLCLDKMNLSHVWKNAGHAVHSTRITAGNDKPSGFDIKRLLKGTILEDHFLVAKRNHLMKELWAECEKNPKIKTKLGVKISEYKNTENGAEVTFADGTTDSADIVVSADGIHSLGRDFVDPDCPPPEHSGLCVFYCILENVDKEKFPDHSTIEIHLNMGMALLMRISETDAMIVVAHQASEKWNVKSQNWTFDVSPEIFHELMEDHDFYKEQDWIDEKMIKGVTNLSHLGIYQQPHVSNWFRGNVILIGDAAHATSPFMGQGANQAMIDGYYLGRCLQDCEDVPSGAGLFFKVLNNRNKENQNKLSKNFTKHAIRQLVKLSTRPKVAPIF